MDLEYVDTIIKAHQGEPGSTMSILEDIQDRYHYLPEDALRMIARKTGISLVDIYGVATFYKAFSLKPKGKHTVSVCHGTACHVRGAQKIVEEFMKQLGIKPGQTTPDNEVTFETVNCLGACALGPTVVVDGYYFPHVSKRMVKAIITKMKEVPETVDAKADSRIFPLQVFCPTCKRSLMDTDYRIEDHPSIRLHITFDGKNGWLRLSSLYGSYTINSEHDVPLKVLSQFYCPHCLNPIPSFSICPECGSPMAALFIREGCSCEVCMRRGCRGHMLNLDQANLNKPGEEK